MVKAKLTQSNACLPGEYDMAAVDTPDQDGTGLQRRPEKPGGVAACQARRPLNLEGGLFL